MLYDFTIPENLLRRNPEIAATLDQQRAESQHHGEALAALGRCRKLRDDAADVMKGLANREFSAMRFHLSGKIDGDELHQAFTKIDDDRRVSERIASLANGLESEYQGRVAGAHKIALPPLLSRVGILDGLYRMIPADPAESTMRRFRDLAAGLGLDADGLIAAAKGDGQPLDAA